LLGSRTAGSDIKCWQELLIHVGGRSVDVRLAKSFVPEKLSKKVQFLQPNNDDMKKRCMQWHGST
jgi:hypothetical protein